MEMLWVDMATPDVEGTTCKERLETNMSFLWRRRRKL